MTISRSIAALALCAGLTATASADRFQRVLGDIEPEHTYSIANTLDGGYITTGYRDFGTGASPDEDVLITKHFADGTIEWQRLWSGPGRDIGYSVKTFPTVLGCVIAAESTSSSDPGMQTLLIRLGGSGDLLWSKYLPGTAMSDPFHFPRSGVALDIGPTNMIHVVGHLDDTPLILSVYATGVTAWNALYSDPITDPDLAASYVFTDIKQDPTDLTLVVSGTTRRSEPTLPSGAVLETQDAFLLRVSDSGAPIWIRNYDFPVDLDPTNEPGFNVAESGMGLDISPGGRIILNGTTDFGGDLPLWGTHLVEVDPAGFPVWGREYRYTSPDGFPPIVTPGFGAVRYDDDLHIVQAGTNRVPGPEHSLMWWVDEFGGPQFMWEYGGADVSRGESVVVHPECGYAMAGQFIHLAPPTPFAFGETFLVKNDHKGETGCAELLWQFEPAFEVSVKPNAIVADYIDEDLDAPPLLLSADATDVALCYVPECGPPPVCPCDLNADGVLDISDIGLFISCFTGSLPCGDIAPVFGVWDLNDVGLFIDCFLGGC